MPNATSAIFANGDSAQAFPKGGLCSALPLLADVWTRFDPSRIDLFRLHIPALAAGRVVYTSSANFPTLADGDPVLPAQLNVAPTYLPGVWTDCFDTDAANPVRFFFALVDAAPGDVATLIVEAAAS